MGREQRKRAKCARAGSSANGAIATRRTRGGRAALLVVDDPDVAAEHLNYLILAAPLDEAMFTARTTPFPPRRLNRWADEAVRVFLAAYGAHAGDPHTRPAKR